MGYLEERANLVGKVAAVVGGAAGIGAAVTLALAKSGVDVAFCDINRDAVATTRAEVEGLGRRVTGRVTDACDPEQLDAFYRSFDDDFDRLDVVVNVVGGSTRGPFADSTIEQWTADIQRNLGWAMQSMSLAIPRIRAGGRGGSIISFTTIEAHRGAAGYSAYAGAKAGLTNFSRALAVELGSERIRVNLVAPDMSVSDSVQKRARMTPEGMRARGLSAESMERAFAAYIPMVVPPSVDSLGDAVLFLASDLSTSVTGTTVHADGGTWAACGFQHWPGDWGWLPVAPPEFFSETGVDSSASGES